MPLTIGEHQDSFLLYPKECPYVHTKLQGLTRKIDWRIGPQTSKPPGPARSAEIGTSLPERRWDVFRAASDLGVPLRFAVVGMSGATCAILASVTLTPRPRG